MFTGIVEEVGKVRYIQLNGNSGVLAVKAAKVLEGTKIGDSIAVNGVCLTVTSLQPDGFTADVMAETIRRSSLGNCKIGSYVNLERAMAADEAYFTFLYTELPDQERFRRIMTKYSPEELGL